MGRLTIRTESGAALKLDNPQNEAEARKQLHDKYLIAIDKLAHYEDLEEQGRLIDGDKLIMSIADWQMTLSPANNEADVFEYNVLESVIEHIAELKELEGVKE